MIEGKEPMRTFSDLLQFFEKKDDGGRKKDKKGKGPKPGDADATS
jgi:hypothetical protein